ncbi:lactosylceramide 1,3-N-acetyl-beta-D-glucosaminyltransferase isoform X2 [Camarhynchus parvulus]|uniref:lactosylceramide 1,3-N-acetyl-beta-D-glucosaminyltransferase isoform X2 n=1 Tax=Geospiza parvula TaxID=87175 RepID=UPI0012380534|nr:lactosylceramide 1,3-N-acetyl-beta-D-glucosaminyltransferase isoform X2 [Camarhynchus parvulus]
MGDAGVSNYMECKTMIRSPVTILTRQGSAELDPKLLRNKLVAPGAQSSSWDNLSDIWPNWRKLAGVHLHEGKKH